MWITLTQILLGLAVLAISADYLVDKASDIARYYGMSSLMIGLTVIAFGTSTPEMVVSIFAALSGSGELAVGNALGSNIANIGLILGLVTLLAPLAFNTSVLKKEMPLLLILTFLSGACLYDLELNFLEGLLLLSGQIVLIFILYRSSKATDTFEAIQPEPALCGKQANPITPVQAKPEQDTQTPILKLWFGFTLSLGLLLASSHILVSGAISLSLMLGIPEAVVGVSIVAIGTSLPELAATLASIRKHQQDMAIGNIIGSNIMNITLVLSMAGLLGGTQISSAVLIRDFSVMLGLTLLFNIFCLMTTDTKQLKRWHGAVWLGIYLLYISYLVSQHYT